MLKAHLPGAVGLPRENLLAAADACDAMAEARSEQEQMAALMQVLRHRELIEVAALDRQMAGYGNTLPGNERCALGDGSDEVGHVELRVPEKLAFRLIVQKNFGLDGFYSNEGVRDLKRHYPFTVCKYVPRRLSVPVAWRGGRARAARVNFQPGTLHLTKN